MEMVEPNWIEQAPGISSWRTQSAHEFLVALRRSNHYWWEGDQIPWVFRGHKDECWELLPSAWRAGDQIIANARSEAARRFEKVKPEQRLHWAFGNHVTGQASFGKNDADLARRLSIESTAELLPVYDFLLTCDRLGLATPISQLPPDPALSPDWLIGTGDPLVGDDFFRFSDIPHYISLAQHHGLPTRLLDWTHDPINAAFFAAGELIGVQAQTDIAVWAIHRPRAMSVKGKSVVFPRLYDGRVEDGNNYEEMHAAVEIVRTPMRENFFLAAQSGQFTSIRGSGLDFMHRGGNRPSLETFVAESGTKEIVLRKLILGRGQVPELAMMLAREEITRSQLMPTHDNVATDVKKLWKARL
jgi:FRG domain